ncbi:hypothetical protein [Nonomuraea longicatena]|uniref:Uncharacterized protein n=1 Tax=Nonomuraea longicatena TaxID=83682 RepID=A0ABP4ATW4_9ACTN
MIPQTRVVAHTRQRLQQIADELTELTPTDFDRVHSTAINPESGKVVIETTHATAALRTALAARYGGDAVALFVTPRRAVTLTGWQNDTSPF